MAFLGLESEEGASSNELPSEESLELEDLSSSSLEDAESFSTDESEESRLRLDEGLSDQSESLSVFADEGPELSALRCLALK